MEKADLKWELNEIEEEEEWSLHVRNSKQVTNGHSEKSEQEWLQDELAAFKNGEEGTQPKQEQIVAGVQQSEDETKLQLIASNNSGSEAKHIDVSNNGVEDEPKQHLVASINGVEQGKEKQIEVSNNYGVEEGTEAKEEPFRQIEVSNNGVEEGTEAKEESFRQIKVSNNGVEEGTEAKEESFRQIEVSNNGVELKQQLIASNYGVEEGTGAEDELKQQLIASNNGVKEESVKQVDVSNKGVGEGTEAQESKRHLIASIHGIEEGTEAEQGPFKSGHSIYYDKDADRNFTSKSSIKKQIERYPGDGVQESAALGIQLNGYLKSDNLSSSTVQPSEDLSGYHHSIAHKSSVIDEIESAESDLINDSDTEVKDFDVENVLEKQNTHDLYCPNCKSCITRRVILRKRKRKIPIPSEDVKRNKLESVVGSGVDVSHAHATNDQIVRDGAGSTPPLTADDYHLDREPEIFRCLSCFSFFVSTGSGFKLFRCFGVKGEKENIRGEQTPRTNKNWFSSIFAFDKGKASVEQGSGIGANAVKNDAKLLVPSDNLKDQSAKSLAIKESSTPAHSSSEITQEAGGNNLVSENQGAKMKGKIAMDTVGNSENATKSREGGTVLDLFDEETAKQPSGSAFSNGVQRNDKNDELLRTAGNLVQDSLPASQPNGSMFIITSTKEESLAIEKSENDLKSSVGILNKGPDKEPLLATESSILNGLDVNGKPKISTEITQEHEQHIKAMHLSESPVANNDNGFQLSSKDVAHPYEVSQRTVMKTKLEIHSKQPLIVDEDALISSLKDALSIQDKPVNITNISVGGGAANGTAGKDTVITVEAGHETTETASPSLDTQIHLVERQRADAAEVYRIEIVKSIIFGGLAESVTSLSVVSSAAGGDADTLNVLALAMANLIGGLFVIFHNLWELKRDCYQQASNQIMEKHVDRYRELLGRRENFILHAVFAVLSYVLFGLVPPVVYGFSFRKSDDKQLKLVAVAAASLVCILMLATGKAYVQRAPKPYFKTIATYIVLGFTVSGVSYAAGILFERLLEKLGIFQSSSTENLLLPEIPGTGAAWASL